jgi:hypothetical protein
MFMYRGLVYLLVVGELFGRWERGYVGYRIS